MSDGIHSDLASIQAAITASCTAVSADGTVRAEVSANRQIALQLSPAAMKMTPGDLAAMILTTQRQAQSEAEAVITERLDTFRSDPRVSVALDNLRDTQASPAPPPAQQPIRTQLEPARPMGGRGWAVMTSCSALE